MAHTEDLPILQGRQYSEAERKTHQFEVSQSVLKKQLYGGTFLSHVGTLSLGKFSPLNLHEENLSVSFNFYLKTHKSWNSNGMINNVSEHFLKAQMCQWQIREYVFDSNEY